MFSGNQAAAERDVYLEKQLEQFEWQLRTLKEVLSANGNPERAEILKQHADEEACALVLSLLDKVPELWRRRRFAEAQEEANPDVNSQVKTETTADLNVLHERRSKAAAEGYERRETELKRAHGEEKAQLTERFQAAEDVLKVKGHSGSEQGSSCSDLSCVCAPTEGGGAAAGSRAAGLQPAEEEGPGVHLQQGPAEEHSGDAPWWPGQAQALLLLLQGLNFLSAGPRQPRCILGVGAGVAVVRHRDEERASAGAEQEASEHGRSGKRLRFRLFHWISCANVLTFSSSSSLLFPDEEEPGAGGPDRSRPAAERGSESANRQLSGSHSVGSALVTV